MDVVRLFHPIFREWFNAINDKELFQVGEKLLKLYADDLCSHIHGQLLPHRSSTSTLPCVCVQDMIIRHSDSTDVFVILYVRSDNQITKLVQ